MVIVIGMLLLCCGFDGAKLEVHYLDIGQGDCTLIQCGDHAMLIDAGNNNKGTEVQEYLRSKNIDTLDYVIGTHPDADHIGGLDVVIYEFDCKNVILSGTSKTTKTYTDVIDAVEAKGYQATCPAVGEVYQLGDAQFQIVAPVGGEYEGSNDWSVGIRLTHGDTSFLFIGDAEEEAEQDMLTSGIELKADVYKVAHHGSKTGTTEAFLTAVAPAYSVISCGEENTYGHPHAEVLNRLRMNGIKTYRTDQQGTIVATSDGNGVTFNMSPTDDWTPGEAKGGSATSRDSPQKSAVESETYIVNKNTKKFHLPNCSKAAQIKTKNKKEVKQTKEELEDEGFSPCGYCLK